MWLLVMKSGGLITQSGGRIGLIVALSAGSYALSFSHYTRPYGLMASTAFAGGTAFVLGVDCYTRAGLKEFWLYIWGKILPPKAISILRKSNLARRLERRYISPRN